MSSPTSSSPVVILPSTQEDVNAYLRAVRLAYSLSHSENAQKNGVNKDNATVLDDSSAHRLPKTPTSTSTETAYGQLDPIPVSTQISSAQGPSNTIETGLVQPRELHLATSTSVNTAETSAGTTLEALERSDGHFPPPFRPANAGTRLRLEDIGTYIPAGAEPETLEHSLTDSSKVSPRHTGPIPIAKYRGPAPMTSYVPGDLPAQRQPYVTNTSDNHTFAVCPVAKRTTELFHLRDSVYCEGSTGFNRRIGCADFDWWLFAGVMMILLFVIALIWPRCNNRRTQRLDEEGGTATWPRPLTVSTNAARATPKLQALKASTNKAVAKLRGKVHKAREQEGGMDEESGTEQYELVAWRSTSRRAVRANVEGIVNHDAGPVGELPISVDGFPAEHLFEPAPPRYESIDGLLR